MTHTEPIALLILLVLAPVTEEAVFRGGFQEALSKRFPNAAAVNAATASLFALAHVHAHHSWWSASVFVPALLVGAAYARWRRLGPCMALHAFFNALWFGWDWTRSS